MMRVCVRVARIWIAISVIVTFAGAAPAAAQPVAGSRVLVMPFAADVDADAPGGAGASLWLGEAAAVLLTDNLSSLGVTVLSREERAEAFDQLQLPMSSALTRATMIRVGELIGASDIVFGEVHLGQQLNVRARVIRLDSGQERPAISGDDALADIFALFDRVAGQIADATGRRRAGAGVPEDLPLDAFESYVKGLVAVTPPAQQRFLEIALRQAPSDSRILLALWSVYSAQDLDDKALAVANAVPATAPDALQARFDVAQSLMALKRFDGAFQELTALYARSPAAAVSNALGIVQLRRGAPTGTSTPAAYFARAISEEAGNTSYLFNLGYAHALAARPADALTWLREAVRFDAASGDAHLVMSAVLTATGRTVEAQREFELARALGTTLETMPAAVPAKVPAGLERIESSLRPPARPRMVTPAQRDQKETAAFHLTRGRTLAESRRDREAAEELRRAIYLAPYEDEPHLLLGRIYLRAGRTPEAADEFKVALWSRETAAAHVALGLALVEQGDKDGARREAQRAVVMAPDSTEARDLLRRIGG
jgi:tetratricopeptide (TPR) repeat protein/TolB-like protein